MSKLTSIIIISVLLLVLLSGCTEEKRLTRESPEIKLCSEDADCIPQPGCHPMACINKKYDLMFGRAAICTDMFACGAAYKVEDCACIDRVCTNKNLNKTCE